ncbi:hypothetical protein SLEP1_g20813 [Rubroshorea leprosula]|uniref:FLZ-type domain-containing protein n=1 Tax=Rubroshorea leprosula TaxID=152421 RepID=A0AAV5JD72_9ROSI|nr:hypothetical protein SLEP1_g20813 [Rubroshorea leprosula]
MLLGKRSRPPMKRTTSMTEITFDLNTSAVEAPQSDPHNPFNNTHQKAMEIYGGGAEGSGLEGLDQRFLNSMTSSRMHRRHSGDFAGTSHFLRACSLCKRRLVPGRDIYMYRGDSAFCSLECRQQQMTQDEKKEKCSLASKKQGAATGAASSAAGSTKGETVAAV